MPWPYDPTDNEPATAIDWTRADPVALNAKPAVWRKLAKADAVRLSTDPRYKKIFAALPLHAKKAVLHVCGEVYEDEEFVAKDPRDREPPLTKRGPKEDILSRLEGLLEEADDAGDLTAKARGIEIMAKVQKLFEKNDQEDKQVTINVVTGVPRA
jgi:hypothetical protein